MKVYHSNYCEVNMCADALANIRCRYKEPLMIYVLCRVQLSNLLLADVGVGLVTRMQICCSTVFTQLSILIVVCRSYNSNQYTYKIT
jgi:hypothetical protein